MMRALCACVCIAVLLYMSLLFLRPGILQKVTSEDGPVENAGAVLFLSASLVFLWASARQHNVCLFLLAAVSFFAFGEEISWGQRLLHIPTVPALRHMNIQRENTLHNLVLFTHSDQYVRAGRVPPVWSYFASFNRLFVLFWMAYYVFLPWAARYSCRVRGMIARLGIPVPLSVFGVFLAVDELLNKALQVFCKQYYTCQVYEVKETVWSMVILATALYFAARSRIHQANIRSS